MTRSVLIGLLCWSAAGKAVAGVDPAPDTSDVRKVRTEYEYGNFKKALDLAQEKIDRGGLTDEHLIELHKYAGLAAFDLNRLEDAERHFKALLEKSPDVDLDPFSVEPGALRFLEEVRTKNKDLLDVIRRGIRDRTQRLRELAEEEERRRRLEQDISRRVTVKTVQQRSRLLNFVPFGVGQFQQNRNRAGALFAAGEGALGAANLTAWIVRWALATTGVNAVPTQTNGTLGQPDGWVIQHGVATRDAFQDSAWRYVQYATAAAFFTVYSGQVLDAVYHHEDEVVTETQTITVPPSGEPAPSGPTPDAVPPRPSPKPRQNEKVPLGPDIRGSSSESSSSLFFYPTPGGAGAGFTLHF
jgi:tetratricopeptide (TPR) repeat protein